MFHSGLHVHYLCLRESFKTMLFEAFLMFRKYSGNRIQEIIENKVKKFPSTRVS